MVYSNTQYYLRHFSLTHIDNTLSTVFQINANAEIDEVVHRITFLAEFVNRFLPVEVTIDPFISLQNWPTTQFFEDLMEWIQSLLFDKSFKI